MKMKQMSLWWPLALWIVWVMFFCWTGCIGNPHVILPCEDTLSNCGKPSNLALPGRSFRPILAENNAAKDLRELRDFIQLHIPDAEISIVPRGQDMPGWEWIPLMWGEMQVWIRRPVVHDRWNNGNA